MKSIQHNFLFFHFPDKLWPGKLNCLPDTGHNVFCSTVTSFFEGDNLVLILRISEDFRIMGGYYSLHVWGASITNFHTVSIQDFVEGVTRGE